MTGGIFFFFLKCVNTRRDYDSGDDNDSGHIAL